MNEPTPQFETQLPGDQVPQQQAKLLVKAFIEKFRTCEPAVTPSNIPTACVLQGRIDHEFLSDSRFLARKEILFYLESADCLRRTTPTSAAHYFSTREPWEDYDVCLFDESLEWCVGVTHNDDIIVIECQTNNSGSQ
jgi:hypothetical protein